MAEYGLSPTRVVGQRFSSASLPQMHDGTGMQRPVEILLVEDSPADVRMMQEALHMAEIAHHLAVVSDGEEALHYLHRVDPFMHVPRPDIVILDIKLPKMSGLGVLREIRASPELQKLPVMMLTSSPAIQDRSASENLGATHFVTKPVGLFLLAGELKIINALVKRGGH